MALRAIAFQATPCGCSACVLAIGMIASTSSRYCTAHSSACMPPSEPPATAASRVIPSSSRSARSARTMSATVMTGKSDPYGRPVAGFVDEGPVVPRHPPSRFELTTKKRSVSKALPGPIMPSHQPRPRPLPASRSSARNPSLRARRGRRRRIAGRVRVAAQRVADQDDVVARGRQRPVGFVGDADRMELAPAVERQRLAADRETASRPCRRSPRRPSTLGVVMRRSYPWAERRACMIPRVLRRRDPAATLCITVIEGAHDG